jgi:hypothetical protein
LGNAALDARRGEYETARQGASDVFTNLQAEIDRRLGSLANRNRARLLSRLLSVDSRRRGHTLLWRAVIPASADRLSAL